MKKIAALIVSLFVMLTLCSCGNSKEDTKANDNANTNVSAEKDSKKESSTVKLSVADTDAYVAELGKTIQITSTGEKIGSFIGAEDKGTSFKCNGNTFELYLFPDGSEEPGKAESGTYELKIGNGMTMKSAVNGNFVLLYKTEDEAVVNAFKAVK